MFEGKARAMPVNGALEININGPKKLTLDPGQDISATGMMKPISKKGVFDRYNNIFFDFRVIHKCLINLTNGVATALKFLWGISV
jgi:hypothetical protein